MRALLCSVRDDGAGGADYARARHGLVGLKDRVEALGGRIFLDSPRGAGTNLRVELPLTTTYGVGTEQPPGRLSDVGSSTSRRAARPVDWTDATAEWGSSLAREAGWEGSNP